MKEYQEWTLATGLQHISVTILLLLNSNSQPRVPLRE